MGKIEKFVQATANRMGLTLLRNSTHAELVGSLPASRCFEILREFNSVSLEEFLGLLPFSKSQLSQDLFVAAATNLKRDGFFVEFGATDGVALSNTHMLESQLGWHGILAEPARMWQAALMENRKAIVSDLAVWSKTGSTVKFVEDAELSTFHTFRKADQHARNGRTYDVSTITLVDLLTMHNAPALIDFLSIDTEGSELEVLEAHDFDKFKFSLICVEHNYTSKRQSLFDLLTSKGYRRVLEHVSQFDDWYVLERPAQETI